MSPSEPVGISVRVQQRKNFFLRLLVGIFRYLKSCHRSDNIACVFFYVASLLSFAFHFTFSEKEIYYVCISFAIGIPFALFAGYWLFVFCRFVVETIVDGVREYMPPE